jgi:hypothetical protein
MRYVAKAHQGTGQNFLYLYPGRRTQGDRLGLGVPGHGILAAESSCTGLPLCATVRPELNL